MAASSSRKGFQHTPGYHFINSPFVFGEFARQVLGNNQGMMVGYFTVIHAAAVQGCAIQPGGISGKTGVSLQKGDAFRHFLENILRNITASGSGIGHHFLLVQALRYGKRLVRRKVQFRVGFLLQRGQVVQKRRLLGGFFPFNGLHCKLLGILCPLQGGYGFGLLLPFGG